MLKTWTVAAEVGREWVSTSLIQTGKLRRVYRIGCIDWIEKVIDAWGVQIVKSIKFCGTSGRDG